MHIKILVPFLFIIAFSSCSDDDGTAASYIGTWVAERIDLTACNDGTEDSDPVQCTDADCYRITFNEDGTFSFQEGLPTTSGTWSADGVVITLATEEDGETVLRIAEGVLQAEFLLLSFTDETSGCVTTFVMNREVVEETPDTSNQ